ncbi:hypothetical protein [Marinococcus sp. PL1-022]|uniref:hypothetical protein n=1 Tax=Marinococcus sp. PL1-022 TaxID=3095363 RepID=UPI0029C544D9|nr:hypothetical protein [Marinococcus sp. PL1-022]MDX6154511.1 hypothetical protein [Marinococcus sp. PL1-022]
MNELISKNYCPHCSLFWQLEEKQMERLSQQQLKSMLSENITCRYCDKNFTFYEGMIEGIITAKLFRAFDLMYDFSFRDRTFIMLGQMKTIKLPKEMKLKEVVLSTKAPAKLSSSYSREGFIESFDVISSELNPETKNKILASGGWKRGLPEIKDWVEIEYHAYGNTKDQRENEVWIELLSQIMKQIQQEQYSAAILSSEIMFESFLDKSLFISLKNQGLNDETSYLILESVGNIQTKTHKLLEKLEGNGLQINKSVNKEWEKLLRKRNKIGHGEEIDFKKEEAQQALKTALEAICTIYIHTDIYT